MAAFRVFRSFLLRTVPRRKLRLALATVSIALAVALAISMRTTEASILRSFEKSAEALAGKSDAVVTRGTGIERSAVTEVEKVGRLRAAPVIQESTIALDWNDSMVLLGIDFARDAKLRGYRVRESDQIDTAALLLVPDSILISRSFAERRGLRLNSTLRLDTRRGTAPFRIAGILDDEGPAKALAGRVVVTAIGTAARHFDRGDRCDRIEVAFDGTTLEELRRSLGPEFRVEPLTQSHPILDYLLAQHRTVFLGITLIASLIGAFIIYNSASLSVAERVKEIGILRAVGARRRDVVGAFLVEAGLLGGIGATAGIGLGIALSRFFLGQAVRQMNMFVNLVDALEVSLPFDAVLAALAVGIGTALAGAFVPALEASRVPPMAAIRATAVGRGALRNFFAGLVLLAGSTGLAFLPGTAPLAVALAVSFVGLALLLPQLLLWCAGGVRFVARRTLPIEGYLAADSIVKSPARTALTVLAFAASLSMVVAVSGTLLGFQHGVNRWFDTIFPFDITVQRSDFTQGFYSPATFPESVISEVEQDPRVERAYGVRFGFVTYRGATILLMAVDIRKFTDLQLRRGIDPGVLPRAEQEGVVLSKNFLALYGRHEEIDLETAEGLKRFRVHGEMEDYSWPRGVVILDREVYRKYWRDGALSYLDVRARDGANVGALKSDLLRSFRGRTTAFVYDTPEVRAHSLALVGDWFQLANAQVVLAIVIGGIGVINTLLISVLTRKRQIGLLRAVGASAGQIQASVAFEAGLTGLTSGLLGCGIGLFLVRFPLSDLVRRASGHEIPFVFPASAIALALASALVIALLAGLVPARFARRVNVIEAIGYE